ncbi:ImmA/IrrE family metallo-endopeptidase [Apilactobacillus xinyiensis]|uniref:ImmA/IrrE family metallo-endopeptidase n=1 Tax=Apilactobacillus xinyiensis TaxID=2841032 RepID=UPI003364B499
MNYNDLITKLLNYAFDSGIGFQVMELKEDMLPFSIPNKKFIIINSNWKNKNEVPFQIAHEIAHVINEDESCLYQNNSYKLKFEHAADVKALEILIPIYIGYSHYNTDNIYPLMEQLRIPNRLINEAKNITKKCLSY